MDLVSSFTHTRNQSVEACKPLEIEDYGLQAEAFTSPPKWHLAHTSWFFETFLLKPFAKDYRSPNRQFEVLFNSYYNGIGDQFPRPKRGLLSRPTVSEVMHYRKYIDSAMLALLALQEHEERETILQRTRLGIEHEQQHQELFYTDLKYSLAINPLFPAYDETYQAANSLTSPFAWIEFEGGVVDIGTNAEGEFAFDNETPRHSAFVQPFALANRLVTNSEYQRFIEDGGYRRPELWLADGWAAVQQHAWDKPLYWFDKAGEECEYTLHGLQKRDPQKPVCHISGYEADAYARWVGERLPTEQEWELAALQADAPVHQMSLHPDVVEPANGKLLQLYDYCWQWTGSAYRPYPGFKTADGAIGEYNGKFMCNQWVLRGSSCVTSPGHARASYRNFFYPEDRWQFSGIRLAKDI